MADQPRIIQPLIIVPPAPEPQEVEDSEAARFVEDNSYVTDLTFEQWVANNRPLPKMDQPEEAVHPDVPTDD